MTRQFGQERGIVTRRELSHRIESYEEGNECTLFPADCGEFDLLTHWITAREGDFVDLADMQ